MKKKFILTLLCILALSIYGCSNSSKANTSSSESSASDITSTVAQTDSNIDSVETDSVLSEEAGSAETSINELDNISNSKSNVSQTTSVIPEVPSVMEVPQGPDVPESAQEQYTESVPIQNTDFVAGLNISHSISQMIVVSAAGSSAIVSMHETDSNGIWNEIMNTSGYVGKNGVGKASENDTKTPSGIYGLTISFGIQPDPGTSLMPYKQVTQSDYWVDDPYSKYYNQFVSTDTVTPDWSSAEHIIDYATPYAYCIAIDYNLSRTPFEGSAIFLHCSNGNPTAGCVSVPKDKMIFILTHIRPGCVILIDTESNISNY